MNWPKLNTPPWATEANSDALQRTMKIPVMGGFVKGHERGRSEARVGFMEEGGMKKRVE